MSKQAKIQKVYPLTPMQEGMLFHSVMDPESGAYCNQLEAELHGELDVKLLEAGFNLLIKETDLLRTLFVHENLQRPRQVVLADRPTSVHYERIDGLTTEEQARRIESFKLEQARTPFRLAKEELMRIAVLQTAENGYRLIWTHHHILMDGWALGLLIQRLFEHYGALCAGKPEAEGQAAPPFSSYVQWLEKQNKENALSYWERYVSGYERPSTLPKRFEGGESVGYDKRELMFTIGEHETSRLTALAAKHGATLNTVVQALWSVLLGRYNNTEDVMFGSVVAGRPAEVAGIDRMIGLFINTIPVRSAWHGQLAFADLVEQMQQQALASEAYDFMPLYDIQSCSALKHDMIDHIVIFENYPVAKELQSQAMESELGFRIGNVHIEEQTNYNLNVVIAPGRELTVKLSYNANAYEPSFLQKTEGHLRRTITQVLERPSIPLGELDLLTEEERRQLLVSFNDTEIRYPKGTTLHGLFEEQAAKTPESIALLCAAERWSYRRLNGAANRLARVLRARGVKEDSVVAVMASRGPDMIVGLLAVLKAGGAYVPIDPELPEERIRFMERDSGAALVLAQRELRHKLASSSVWLDIAEGSDYAIEDSNVTAAAGPKHLAYIIYTSGTTGQPKGVMVEHRAIANTIRWRKEEYGFDESDTTLLFLSFSFDAFVSSLFAPLVSGSAVVLAADEEAKDPLALKQAISRHRVTHFSCVPSLYAAIIEAMTESEAASLRIVTLGGEKVSGRVLELSHRLNAQLLLINEYGPTENSVVSTIFRDLEPGREAVIGHPIANAQAYVLDKHDRLQPVGAVGELAVAGAGLARGYVNRQELTAERFAPHPFAPGQSMYRTGDAARWLPSGNLEFLERLDHQVKIRGYRIELGEVEAALRRHTPVEEAVVLAVTDPAAADGSRVLCAYYTSSSESLEASVLQRHAARLLPAYMVPAYWIRMDCFPLTPNGKLDRRALPQPQAADASAGGLAALYAEPATPTEQALAELWREVLKVEKIGTRDSFFALGGHSLKAMMLVSKMQKNMNAIIPIRRLFEQPTIEQLARLIDAGEGEAAASVERAETIPPAPAQLLYPLSSAQRRMFVVSELDRESTASNMPGAMLLEGELSVERFRDAYRELIARHETLRTSFAIEGGMPMQRIHGVSEVRAEIEFAEAGEDRLEELARTFIRPFDLSRAPLIRLLLVRIGPARHLFLFDLHHIVSDGTSMGIIVREFIQLMSSGALPPLTVQYKDYAIWQNARLGSEHLRRQESYWLELFKGDIPVLDLPTDRPRPAVQSFEGGRRLFRADRSLKESLGQLARETGATMFMVLLAAYQALLGKYTGQEDIVVGTPIAGRTHAELEPVIGMFVGTLALRGRPEGKLSFLQLIEQVKRTTLLAYENQEYPFESLVEKLELRRDTSRNPLFDTMFILQNLELRKLELEGLAVIPYEVDAKVAKFDLAFEVREEDDGLEVCIVYRTSLFEEDTIDRMGGYFLTLLEQAASAPYRRLEELEMLSAAERRELLQAGAGEAKRYEAGATLHGLFERQSETEPERPALFFENEVWSYGRLNEEATRMAYHLAAKGVKAGSRVAIMAERSPAMVAGVLAVLKAGGAYVPVDPNYPEERIRYLLQDSGAELVLAEPDAIRQLHRTCTPEQGPVWLNIQELDLYEGGTEQLPEGDPERLAYIIYTSGTTGMPKGVAVAHRSIAHNLQWRKEAYGFTADDVVLQLFSFAFDGFLTSAFTPLISGASVVLLGELEAKDAVAIARSIEERGVSHFIAVPSLYSALLDMLAPHTAKRLRIVTLAGEKVTPSVLNRSQQCLPGVRIANEYGPTENSVVAAAELLLNPNAPITIGRPIAGTQALILSGSGQLQPIGVPGELCLAGSGLALGYWNRPELTAEKFAAHPDAIGGTMYRTGDLARRLKDGKIDFIGRMDHQVKVRGFRIELEEIESALLRQPGMREAVVLAREDQRGHPYLCAYFTAEEELQAADVHAALSRALPPYMVPSHTIRLDRMPLTPNGKIDRKDLPEPEQDRGNTAYVKPRNEMESLLCGIWQDVVGGGKAVGIRDNFFELGGDSIKAIQVAARLYALGLQLDVKDLFRLPTIAEVSASVAPAARRSSQEPVIGEFAPTPIQRWFFDRHCSAKHHWNQAVMLHLPGGFERVALQQALGRIAVHHDALRLVFREEPELVAYNRGLEEGELYGYKEYDFTEMSDSIEFAEHIHCASGELQSSFDVNEGPLLKTALFRTSDGDHLLLAAHHLVIDGVSWRILFEDLAAGYTQATEGVDIALPDKTDSLRDWSERLSAYAQSRELQQEIPYWHLLESAYIEPLPKDRQAAGNSRKNSASAEFELSPESSGQLLKRAHHAYHTDMNDLLLAALALAVREWTGSSQVAVLLEGHGREELPGGRSVNLSRTIGWFTSQAPIVLGTDDADDLSKHIKTVKETLRRMPNKGIGYDILRYMVPQPLRGGLTFGLKPDIAFNYLGQFETERGQSELRPSSYDPGESFSPDADRGPSLNLNGMLEGGSLKLRLDYNALEYDETTVLRLMDQYHRQLLRLIQHCVNREESERTPSDFSAKGLELEEMDDIFGMLSDKLG